MGFETRRLARFLASAALVSLAAVPARAETGSAALSNAPGGLAVASVDPAPGASMLGGAAKTDPEAPDPNVAVRRAVDLYRKGDLGDGAAVNATASDPAARAVVEWLALRSGPPADFDRIAAFLKDHPDWPASAALRRRAEESLLAERKPADTVLAFFKDRQPASAAGKYVLALALKAKGREQEAAVLIRETWRNDGFGRDFEDNILENFPGLLDTTDHRIRMERMLFKENWTAAKRAAECAGKDYLTLVKARMAVEDNPRKAQAALDAVPEALRSDTSFLFARAQMLRRLDKPAEAAKVLADMTRDPAVLVDGDAWWTERRLIARKLLDQGDAKTAYRVASRHAAQSDAQTIEAEFHAGWIALRFLDEPSVAAMHFADAAKHAETPISVSRVAYWQGRAAEAEGDADEAKAFYGKAAEQPIAYYGQLARAKLGLTNLPLRTAPEADAASRAAFDALTPVKAIRLLHTAGADDLAAVIYIDLARHFDKAGQLDALASLAAESRQARTLVVVGKLAVQRGFPLDLHAYPVMGIPQFEPVGDGKVEKAMVYAIARQESVFDPRAKSSAGARGLMQLMPATARRTAQHVGLKFDADRLLDDPVYNAKLGSAHLGELMQDWKGSFILTFAAYNAGGGNVRKWIAAYGDPRDPAVDPVDWIERIPFSETRNYVQRVMENLQVYRRRLDERSALLFDSDLKQGRQVQ